MKRHYTPQELCQMAKKTQNNRRSAKCVPWSICSIFACDNLLRQEGWKTKRLQRYLQLQKEYFNRFDSDSEQWYEQQKRLTEFAGGDMHIIIQGMPTERDIPKGIKKGTFLYQLELREIENSRQTLYELARGMLSHYNALMDLGFSKKKLIKNKEQMQQYLDDFNYGKSKPLVEIRNDIANETGVFIEIMETLM